MNFTPEFQMYVEKWRNEDAYNNWFHTHLGILTDSDSLLKRHRDWVEEHQFGFGDRPFHSVWRLLVDQMPQSFSFLEIGVFKGQALSLVGLLAKSMKKQAFVFGVTTLTNTEDVRCKYPTGPYLDWINEIHNAFEVSQPCLIVGKSNEAGVLEKVAGPYDMVYIDGGHDYADVVADIKNYAPKTKVGGFLIMDDASINRINIGNCWPGLEDVAQAVKDYLDNDERFKLLFACGHLNVFHRVKS